MNFVDALYEMHYEKTYEMTIWIDYELSDLNYASSMKIIWIDVWTSIFQQAYSMKMYENVFLTNLLNENVWIILILFRMRCAFI